MFDYDLRLHAATKKGQPTKGPFLRTGSLEAIKVLISGERSSNHLRSLTLKIHNQNQPMFFSCQIFFEFPYNGCRKTLFESPATTCWVCCLTERNFQIPKSFCSPCNLGTYTIPLLFPYLPLFMLWCRSLQRGHPISGGSIPLNESAIPLKNKTFDKLGILL